MWNCCLIWMPVLQRVFAAKKEQIASFVTTFPQWLAGRNEFWQCDVFRRGRQFIWQWASKEISWHLYNYGLKIEMFKWSSILSVCFSIIRLSSLNPQMCFHSVKHFEVREVNTATEPLCHHVHRGQSHEQINMRGDEALLTAVSLGNLL